MREVDCMHNKVELKRKYVSKWMRKAGLRRERMVLKMCVTGAEGIRGGVVLDVGGVCCVIRLAER